jgi:hypothetical protein
LDNVFAGKDVNIEKIPTPVWHEHDGRRSIEVRGGKPTYMSEG